MESKVIVLLVLTALFIALVAVDGRRKLRRKKENQKNRADA